MRPQTNELSAGDSSVERAYAALRRMAVDYTVAPGSRLNEVHIARDLGMSRVPIREAMNRLVSEGLLTFEANRGFACRRLSVSEVTALYELRCDLETAAVLKIDSGTAADALAALEAHALAALDGHDAQTASDLVSEDENFHLRLASITGNAERSHLLESISARIRFVRQLNLELAERRVPALDEHVQIVRALRRGDKSKAAELMRRHLTVSLEVAEASVQRALSRIYAEAVA